MKKTGVILLLSWMLMRLIFHSFSYDNSATASIIYYISNDVALCGLFMFLYSVVNYGILKRFLKIVLIYSGFCLITDILMLSGIGAHDFWLYTAISISILSIGLLWAKFA